MITVDSLLVKELVARENKVLAALVRRGSTHVALDEKEAITLNSLGRWPLG